MALQFRSWFHIIMGQFCQSLLEKFYPVHKTAQIKKNILQFKQMANEPFWKYFKHFKDLLAQCPHHEIEK